MGSLSLFALAGFLSLSLSLSALILCSPLQIPQYLPISPVALFRCMLWSFFPRHTRSSAAVTFLSALILFLSSLVFVFVCVWFGMNCCCWCFSSSFFLRSPVWNISLCTRILPLSPSSPLLFLLPAHEEEAGCRREGGGTRGWGRGGGWVGRETTNPVNGYHAAKSTTTSYRIPFLLLLYFGRGKRHEGEMGQKAGVSERVRGEREVGDGDGEKVQGQMGSVLGRLPYPCARPCGECFFLE